MADDDRDDGSGVQASKLEHDQATLRRMVDKFLDDANVKEAPLDKKRTFLRSKGLSDSDIAGALENKLASDATLEVSDEQVSSPATEHESSTARRLPQESSANVLPIVTYPEFLQYSERPPPFVTTSGLVTSAYIITGAAALVYGAGRFLVQPMMESLTSSRHLLYETASENLSKLNDKLESNVSVKPDLNVAPQETDDDQVDPSSYFSRSTGTQTLPDLATSPSVSTTVLAKLPSRTEQHATRLGTVKSSLAELSTDEASDQAVKGSIEELRGLLNQLPRAVNPTTLSRSGTTWTDTKGDDAVAKVKAEIKGVKGVLLSARNFPSSVVR